MATHLRLEVLCIEAQGTFGRKLWPTRDTEAPILELGLVARYSDERMLEEGDIGDAAA
jgi:hypothetical protein